MIPATSQAFIEAIRHRGEMLRRHGIHPAQKQSSDRRQMEGDLESTDED